MTSKEQLYKMIEGRFETIQALTMECIDLIYNAAYNEAIENAAKKAECTTMEYVDKNYKNAEDWLKVKVASEIRKLKK